MNKDEQKHLRPITYTAKKTKKIPVREEKPVVETGVFSGNGRVKRVSGQATPDQTLRRYKSKLEPKINRYILDNPEKTLKELLEDVNNNLQKTSISKIIKDTHPDDLDAAEVLGLHDALTPRDYAEKLIAMKKGLAKKAGELEKTVVEFKKRESSSHSPHSSAGAMSYKEIFDSPREVSPAKSGTGSPAKSGTKSPADPWTPVLSTSRVKRAKTSPERGRSKSTSRSPAAKTKEPLVSPILTVPPTPPLKSASKSGVLSAAKSGGTKLKDTLESLKSSIFSSSK